MTRNDAQKLIDLFNKRDSLLGKLEQFEQWGGDIVIFSRYEGDYESLDFSNNTPIIRDVFRQAIDDINNQIREAGGSL